MTGPSGEAKLALSSCSAPIAELSDCFITVLDGCFPVEQGCARYLEKPGCSGTIVISADGSSGSNGTAGTGGAAGAIPAPNNGCTLRLR